METTLIKSFSDFHCDGFHNKASVQFEFSDIEMDTLQSLAYISLKDIMPESPPSIISPMINRKESWREIPMKDPLLQQAAWAYLQPIEIPEADRSLLIKVKEKCFWLFGCLSSALVMIFRSWFSMAGKKKKLKTWLIITYYYDFRKSCHFWSFCAWWVDKGALSCFMYIKFLRWL